MTIPTLRGLNTLIAALREKGICVSREAISSYGQVERMENKLTEFMCINGLDWANTTGWEMTQDLPNHTHKSVTVSVALEVERVEVEEDSWVMHVKKLEVTLEDKA